MASSIWPYDYYKELHDINRTNPFELIVFLLQYSKQEEHTFAPSLIVIKFSKCLLHLSHFILFLLLCITKTHFLFKIRYTLTSYL